MRLLTALSIAAAMAVSTGAHAAVTFTTSATDTPPAGYSVVDSFDTAPAAGYSYSGTNFTAGDIANVAAAPFGDSSTYAYVLGGDTATFSSGPTLLTGLGLYIGSVDTFNTIAFYGPGDTLVGSFTGTQILPPANGNQGSGGSAYVNFNFSSYVDKVVFSSSTNSFEFDDISVSAAPEPASWALMLGGIGILGGLMRVMSARRRERDADGALA